MSDRDFFLWLQKAIRISLIILVLVDFFETIVFWFWFWLQLWLWIVVILGERHDLQMLQMTQTANFFIDTLFINILSNLIKNSDPGIVYLDSF